LVYLKNGTVLEQIFCSLIGGGWISGRLWNYKDVTEKTRVEEKLKFLAATDDLTGLWNRRHFMDRAEYEIAQARRHDRPLCIIQLRSTDTIGRLGGEEFVILFPDTDLQTAYAVAEKTRTFFARNRVDYDGKILRVTISIGVTSLTPENKHVDALLRQADEACYAAKDGGRNRTILWNEALRGKA
jgi:PleD family two-component response regulator